MWAGESGNVAAKLSKQHKIPLVINICGGELAEIKEINYGSRLKYWQKRFVDNSLNAADKIVSGSDFITDKIEEYYGKDVKDKTVKIPFGVDEKVFYPDKSIEHNKKFNLVNIANAVPVKAHESLFKAIKIVSEKYPEVKLRIYGRDDKHTLEKLAASIGVGKTIEINDFIEHEKIAHVLKQAGIYVLSSLYESQNMSIIEAGFCDLPVVSTDVGAAREVTDHIVKPGDYENLAIKIVQVIDNYEEEAIKSKEKIAELQKKFSLQIITDKFEKLYTNLKS